MRPASESVSKLHCAIVQRDDDVFVRDMKSTNGTFLNNDRIEGEVPVKDGDLLRVGPLVFAIKVKASKASSSGPSTDEDQAASWLLDYKPTQSQDSGSKTTMLDPSGAAKALSDQQQIAEADTKVDPKSRESAEPPKPKTPTHETAGDLLEKLLDPTLRKKKR
jgi:pSer/pThr/pTyr-binding forkhead associated (FHA) protein